MHARYRLAARAIEHGTPVIDLLKREIARHGSVEAAARELNVSASAIYYWLRLAGHHIVTSVAVVPVGEDNET